MIGFSCKKCGKRFERSEDAAGTLLFCDCGEANRVPWESESAIPVANPVVNPSLAEPIYESIPMPEPPAPQPETERAYPGGSESCFNHPESVGSHTCPDCGLRFCPDCVIQFEGRTLCGPCKNLHVRKKFRAPMLSLAAVFSLIVALVGAPFTLFLLVLMRVQAESSNAVVIITLIGLAPQAVGLMLGIHALYRPENDAHAGGRGLALSGMISTLVLAILVVEMAINCLYILE